MSPQDQDPTQSPIKGRKSRSLFGSRINTRSNASKKHHESGLVGHLIELRDRMLRSVIAIGLIFLCMAPFANDLYAMLAQPLVDALPSGTSMIATEVASPFLTPFKFTLVLAVFIGMPVLLYQFWSFIAPGLYKHERRMMVPLLVASSALFYAGVLFAFYVVFPLVFSFLISITPVGVSVATDIAKYLDFVLKLFFAFGLAFEIPIATIVMVWAGVTTPDSLAKKRPYVIVGAFVLGMLFTPPDMVSQTLLAIPMWMLFEVGLLISRVMVKRKAEREAAESDDSAST